MSESLPERQRALLEVDSRRRISLGALAQHDRYFVDVEDDGVIVLTPVIVMSVAEFRLHAAVETARKIDDFLDHPETGTRRRRPTGSHPVGDTSREGSGDTSQ
jgi:hypothetical protein